MSDVNVITKKAAGEKDILVLMPVKDCHKKILEKAGRGCHFTYGSADDLTEKEIARPEIIIGNLPPERIKECRHLKWLQLASAGSDDYVKPGILDQGTILTCAVGAYGKSVAEHMFAMMLMLQKKLHLYRDDQTQAAWADEGSITSITDMTVLVVGLGDIGQHFAGMCSALGGHTVGVKRRMCPCPEGVDELYTAGHLDELLPRADVVASFLPGTKENYHIYTEERFGLMKSSAIFLNAGRGSAVDTDVLYEALASQQIASAGLDVTDPEPLPPNHPLWKLPNVMITPHIAGGYHLAGTLERIIGIAAANLDAYLHDGTMINVVAPVAEWRK